MMLLTAVASAALKRLNPLLAITPDGQRSAVCLKPQADADGVKQHRSAGLRPGAFRFVVPMRGYLRP